MGQRARQKPKHLPAKLLAIRKHLGVSQSQMVRLLDFQVSAHRVSEYEHGVREPSLIVLLRYSLIAGVNMEMLVNDRIDITQFRDALKSRPLLL